MAENNKEIERDLFDLCNSLNSLTVGTEEKRSEARRASKIDPGFVLVAGPKTTSTSEKWTALRRPQRQNWWTL